MFLKPGFRQVGIFTIQSVLFQSWFFYPVLKFYPFQGPWCILVIISCVLRSYSFLPHSSLPRQRKPRQLNRNLKHTSDPYFIRFPLRSLKVLIYMIPCATVTSWQSKLKRFAKLKVVMELLINPFQQLLWTWEITEYLKLEGTCKYVYLSSISVIASI